MSLYRITDDARGKKQTCMRYTFVNSNNQTCTIPSNMFIDKGLRITDIAKHGDNISEHVQETRKPPHPSPTRQMGESKLPTWHYSMEQAFESFLIRLDDIFLSLKRDNPKDTTSYGNAAVKMTTYRDICEKLRTEILIAMDRLEFIAMPMDNFPEEKSRFLEKLNGLKNQLSDLRWQYHNAIKELGTKII